MDFELVPGVPTDLNRMLLAGTIDFGPISSIAYARNHHQLLISRRLSISSWGAVDSIQLVAKRALGEIERVALTPKSATSVALLKTILLLRFGRRPLCVELRQPPAEALERVDAVLLIGDDALETMHFPPADARLYDLGELWREWTGLPMVYAVWATRRDFYAERGRELRAVEEELARSMDHSRAQAPEVVESALGLTCLGRVSLGRYFEILRYDFRPEYEEGLRRFYGLAFEAGELSEVPEVAFFGEDWSADRAVSASRESGAEKRQPPALPAWTARAETSRQKHFPLKERA